MTNLVHKKRRIKCPPQRECIFKSQTTTTEKTAIKTTIEDLNHNVSYRSYVTRNTRKNNYLSKKPKRRNGA